MRKMVTLKLVNMVTGISVPVLAGGLSFITFSLLGNTLTPAVAFSTLSMLNLLRMAVSFFPEGVRANTEMYVSLVRLQTILDMPELDPGKASASEIHGVEIKNGSFKWNPEGKEAVLQDLSLTVRAGSITAIVGSIGMGKSSILSAIMREMIQTGGALDVSGSLSYVPQQAWIMNATLRENVFFGAPFNEERYRTALTACALDQDVLQLPGGDMTEIGERGVNLSGGQKQRVALARAVYSNSDIYLLDDPLGAVDTLVGRTLFDKCIRGALASKAVILVTHQLQYLRNVDHIIVMRGGQIAEQGTYQQLMDQEGELAHLVASEPEVEGGAITRRQSTDGTQKKPQTPQLLPQPSSQSVFKTTVKEDRGVGGVSLKVYKQYMVEGGGIFAGVAVLLLYATVQGTRMGIDSWLSYWVQFDSSQPDLGAEQRSYFILVYVGLLSAFVVILVGCGIHFYRVTLIASTQIHNTAFKGVLAAPMSFFDTTPVGRIINRFSNDMNQIDNFLPDTLDQALYFGCQVLGTLCLVIAIFPYFLVVLVPLGFVYYKVQEYFRLSSRELKRLDGISRSPLYAHLSATLQGLPTIRAYNAQARFEEKNREQLDTSNSISFTFGGANRWLGFRLDLLALVVLLFSSMFSVFAPVSPSTAGLVLAYVLQLTGQFQWCVRQSVETETKMTSVERLLHYSALEVCTPLEVSVSPSLRNSSSPWCLFYPRLRVCPRRRSGQLRNQQKGCQRKGCQWKRKKRPPFLKTGPQPAPLSSSITA